MSSFIEFLSEKLSNGELMEEWDNSLVGRGREFDLSEEDVTEVAAFSYRLAAFLEKNYKRI